MNKLFFIGLPIYLFLGLLSPTVNAATMNNDSYTLDNQSVQIQPFKKELTKPKVQTQKIITSGDNYTVATSNPDAFTFELSQDSSNFGKLQATNPVLRNLTLGISSSRGYQILATEDHPLQTETQVAIPDTTCDNGSCSESTPAPWVNTLTYGFGYRLDTMEPDSYKQFADSSRNEAFQPILEGLQALNQEAKITYRINISGTQTVGAYTNVVTYIATPDF